MARQMGFELWVLPPRATLSRVRSESDFAIEQTTAFCAVDENDKYMLRWYYDPAATFRPKPSWARLSRTDRYELASNS